MNAIIGWIINRFLDLALTFGIPYLVDYLVKKFPWLKDWAPTITKLVEDLLKAIKPVQEQKAAFKEKMLGGVGIGRPRDLVRE